MPLHLRPLNDQIILKKSDEETKIGKFYIPETYRKTQQQGTVVAVGPGIDRPIPVKPGEVVLFQKNAGASYELEPGNFITVIQELDLICVVEDNDKLSQT